MCLLLFAYRCHPEYPLLLLANRDEFYRRPTAPAAPWPGEGLVAGRDLQAGGTWAGIARGRVAAVTNIREPARTDPADPLSRGDIPRMFLRGAAAPGDYAAGLAVARYRGFNALLFQQGATPELLCAGNRHPAFSLPSGIHGISNGAPDAPWPKVVRGKDKVARLLRGIGPHIDRDNFVHPALALLQDRVFAPEHALPDTGVSHELELALSPLFVHIEEGDFPATIAGDHPGAYGTRASTLIAVDRHGHTQLWEQTYRDGQAMEPLRHFHFD